MAEGFQKITTPQCSVNSCSTEPLDYALSLHGDFNNGKLRD